MLKQTNTVNVTLFNPGGVVAFGYHNTATSAQFGLTLAIILVKNKFSAIKTLLNKMQAQKNLV